LFLKKRKPLEEEEEEVSDLEICMELCQIDQEPDRKDESLPKFM
jgi:hypothetical protein